MWGRKAFAIKAMRAHWYFRCWRGGGGADMRSTWQNVPSSDRFHRSTAPLSEPEARCCPSGWKHTVHTRESCPLSSATWAPEEGKQRTEWNDRIKKNVHKHQNQADPF